MRKKPVNRPLSGVCEGKKTVIEQNQVSGVWGEGRGDCLLPRPYSAYQLLIGSCENESLSY